MLLTPQAMRMETGRARVIEVVRREWVQALVREDPALGIVLPVRLYVFEQSDGTTMVSYRRPGAELETHEREAVRSVVKQIDEKLEAIVQQATTRGGATK
jgi:uncharacterized protein (DUF302 family)